MVRTILLLLAAATPCFAADEWESLFNGRDLSGWEGDTTLWSVEDGAITGRTTDDSPLPYNKFLIWRGGTLDNFELRLIFRLEGNSNSGVQYRSLQLRDAGEFVVGGYQCDIHPTDANNGMLYDERGRGIIAQRGQKVIIDEQGRKWLVGQTDPVEHVDLGQWNEMVITAVGNHLVQKINGKTTVDVVDHQAAEREFRGLLAFQVHRGPAMKAQFKDIQLKRLEAGGVLSVAEAPIPEGATELGGRVPAGKNKAKAKAKAKERATDKDAARTKNRRAKQAANAPANAADAQAKANQRFLDEQAARALAAATAEGTLRAPSATLPETMKIAKDFRVELLYSVPKEVEGSWVSMCVDPKGRLIVCDQDGGLFRVTPPPIGQSKPLEIEKIPADIGEAQGLLWAFDSFYVVVNTAGKYPSGVYRVRDVDGDDQLESVELLRALDGKGEHGPHAVLLSPDGQSLHIVCGNGTKLAEIADSRVPLVWGEDHLLPRMPDGRGFMRDVLAPGGCIYKIDPDGKRWELVCNGFRNEYDAAFNREGELFAYDADMEWDMNTPWYRPTRVNHVTSGAEFGWRNGAGKWPAYYADSLPAVVNIGPGSPTGVTFGYGAKFPARYQEALFICDWSYGKLYAVHLTPVGATYRGELEEFITGTPLPLTDLVINAHDGAMYFAIGGRRTTSGLYRVTYVGQATTMQATATPPDEALRARALRRSLEALHRTDSTAVETAWPHLGHADRHIRFAARVAIEHQPPSTWQARALAESDPQAAITALLALVRTTSTDPFHRTPATPPLDEALKRQVIEALARIQWRSLADAQKLDLLRVYAVLFNRMGPPDAATRERLIAQFDANYPAGSRELNAELCPMLVYLEAPSAAAKTVALLAASPTQEEQIDLARALRVLKTGWTPELREQYFNWFLKAAGYRGGASFGLFVLNIKNDAIAALPDEEKARLQPIIDAKPATDEIVVAPPRPFVKQWTMDELLPLVSAGLANRDFDRGRMLFGAASCFACHRYNDEGGAFGPDLTGVAGRFSARDLLESIVEPSKTISDQYAAITVVTQDGRVVNGRIVNLSGDTLRINTNMLNPDALENVDTRLIEEMMPSKLSMMPQGLLNTLDQEEVLDLMAYLLSRGDRSSAMFQASAK